MRTESSKVAIAGTGLDVSLGHGPSKNQVLNGVSIKFQSSKWTCIVGPNGAGKSTLLKTLAGLLPHRGEVQLFERELSSWSNRVRAQRLSWLGQNEASSDDLKVWDVVMLGRMPHQQWLAPPNESDRVAVEDSLHATQAWKWRERTLGQLSGGERQRVLLARALAVQAQVLLMDEPLANLDPPHQVDWLNLVRELVMQGKTVVSVLHEISMALHADELVVMRKGSIVHHGACHDLATHKALEAVFDHRINVRSFEGKLIAMPAIAI